jgi:hypothetical protein
MQTAAIPEFYEFLMNNGAANPRVRQLNDRPIHFSASRIVPASK